MSEDNSKEIESGIRDKTLEERISILSTTTHETLRDLAALSMDLLYPEEGQVFIRKTIEDNGRKFEEILLPEIGSRTVKNEQPDEESGDFKKKEIQID
jgi:hypothetical protein